MRTVADLGIGEQGFISGFTDEKLSLKLLEMGCLPGTKLVVEKPAPLGDPMRIKLGGEYSLSLRLDEANIIMVR